MVLRRSSHRQDEAIRLNDFQSAWLTGRSMRPGFKAKRSWAAIVLNTPPPEGGPPVAITMVVSPCSGPTRMVER